MYQEQISAFYDKHYFCLKNNLNFKETKWL